ncbi:dihydrofolate reductase family protein [Nocardioides endophyticus]|uniref:Dihydrofolate reductase family protein n=1 Tax=Nocardioides endophyticus TaxID=1353775 RepID=A0ABP8YVL3_9ACTN
MTLTTAHLTVSLDGFVAGPDQTLEDPLGRGAEALHRWMFESDLEVDARWAKRILPPAGGAYVMGRNMYGPVRGEWSSYDGADGGPWRGWWGEDPPYHAPVFVLTHHEHEPIEMAGGTTFHFVTGGFGEALRLARAAGNGNVDIAGGASTVRQALAAGELDELTLDIAPVLLRAGERIFDGTVDVRLEPVEAEHSPWATHVRYAVSRPGGRD